MSDFGKPEFRFQRVMSDGAEEEPQVLELHDVKYDWKMGRRGFLLTGGLVGAALAAGCMMPKIQYDATDNLAELPDPLPEPQVGGCEDVVAYLYRSNIQIAFTHDKKLLSRGADKAGREIKFWAFPSGQLLETYEGCKSFVLSPDGRYLATTKKGCEIGIIYDLTTGQRIEIEHEGYIAKMAFSPDGQIIAAISIDKKMKLWEIPSGRLLKTTTAELIMPTYLAFDPTGNLLHLVGHHQLTLWDVASYTVKKSIELKKFADEALLAANGRRLITVDRFDLIQVWDVPEYRLRHTIVCTGFFTLSRDGRLLTYQGKNDISHIFDLLLDKDIRQIKGSLPSISSDGKLVATYFFRDKNVIVWEVDSGKVRHVFSVGEKKITSLKFSPDNRYLVATRDQRIGIWDLQADEFVTCLFDREATEFEKKAVQFTATNQYGQEIVYTLPCGSPLPPGAVCTCNCVAGTYVPPKKKKKTPTGVGGSHQYCSCDKICTCVPIYY
ncbi:MAG TPA: WD40 repeat domain-containing protein [bacterium]|nr:WD40 repeat domain-containing protein [bacterium]